MRTPGIKAKNIIKSAVVVILVLSACKKESTSLSTSDQSEVSVKVHYIGERFGGGIIFYLDSTGQHGLIASLEDPEEPSVWAFHDTLTNARLTQLGGGRLNTFKICRVQGDPVDEAEDYAALECLEFNFRVYKDWFLPSKDELNEMYKQKGIIGGFNTFSYWSSTEANVSHAWFQNFLNGSQIKAPKLSSYATRPIRYF